MNIDFTKYTNIELKMRDFSNLDDFLAKYKGNMGWCDLDKLANDSLLSDLKRTASRIKDDCDVFLVIGIGGSYLGAKAVIDAITPYFNNGPEIIFIGNSLSSEYLNSVLDRIKDKSVYVNYISKSLKTLESAVAFKVILNDLKDKYSDLEDRIIYTTSDIEAVPKGFKSFLLPSDIGGRYSVFTPVGLLPMLIAGINIDELLRGALSVNYQDTFEYVSFRNMMRDKSVEAFVSYEPKMIFLIEWLKQLFGESLGKNKGGLLPIGLNFTTDLHSLGQFIQEGSNILFETVLKFDPTTDIEIEGMGSMNELNNIALESTALAHKEVAPSIIIEAGVINEYNIGRLMQFFMWSCAIAGYIDNINPFDQEGVEVYKRIMNAKISNKKII